MAVIIIIVVLLAIFVLFAHNSLTKEKNRLELAEVELKKYEESGTEEEIDKAKKYYNAVLRDYNTKVESFPFSIVAEMFNFPKIHTDNFDEGL
jgi:hypothetical protein